MGVPKRLRLLSGLPNAVGDSEERWPRLFGQFGGLVKLIPVHNYAANGIAATVSGARPGDGGGAILW
jgi:hypothetical protein